MLYDRLSFFLSYLFLHLLLTERKNCNDKYLLHTSKKSTVTYSIAKKARIQCFIITIWIGLIIKTKKQKKTIDKKCKQW